METYSAYWSVLAEAGRTSPERARELLKPYVKGGYLDHLVDGLRDMVKQRRDPKLPSRPRSKSASSRQPTDRRRAGQRPAETERGGDRAPTLVQQAALVTEVEDIELEAGLQQGCDRSWERRPERQPSRIRRASRSVSLSMASAVGTMLTGMPVSHSTASI
ncbi:hypothetical protein [Nonomuraea polychroma]|uniref:hypothetical protein n=1 Tax=Nonomuraea polychroma TaxID=46176 RepID=UPI000FDDB00D|nr:hypothetical protein [Nonomuraea polychroma]